MSKKPQKIYAVRKGRTTGILMSWADCLKSVDRFPDAQYKSFPRGDISAANDYLNQRKREHAPNLLSKPVFGGAAMAAAEVASLAVAASKFGEKMALHWRDIRQCPPAPFKWVNVVYENADGELQLYPVIMYRTPEMKWVQLAQYPCNGFKAMAAPTSDQFRYYLEIPEIPVK